MLGASVTAVIDIANLYKAYGDVSVLQGLNLRVGAGESFGLLGPNGAGKSTLIHLMLGFLRPDRGQIALLGTTRLEQIRLRVGYLPERQRYHMAYSAREYLRFLGSFSGLTGAAMHERVDRELALVGLTEVADRRLATFSKGMLQRLGIAQALLMDPDLLLIDEPTSGLDPTGQREVIDLLNEVRQRNHTLFLCTHYMHEIDQLCDRVGIMANGRIAVERKVADLQGIVNSVRIKVQGMTAQVQEALHTLGPGIHCEGQSVRISQNSPRLQAAVLRTLLDANVVILMLEPLENPIERLYLETIQATKLPSGLHTSLGMFNNSQRPILTRTPPEKVASPERQGERDPLLHELLQTGKTEDK
ncbi:ABC transporter ATP-binding protein [Candidatus Chloroploca asiatica]|uniref:ABC transporter domain-containing protein n=1 Tax=Candidatus Chloroploca asiatica TaxID=1506545 RepID=A0A2H3KKR5_9CHLR|nr:ABC transporter ATP-binding protein [Candidatus Chloroploca asiatica]PDV97820.1 hypothetical protein A9Q02_17380 [Candidatus Chloroploca asiatica]